MRCRPSGNMRITRVKLSEKLKKKWGENEIKWSQSILFSSPHFFSSFATEFWGNYEWGKEEEVVVSAVCGKTRGSKTNFHAKKKSEFCWILFRADLIKTQMISLKWASQTLFRDGPIEDTAFTEPFRLIYAHWYSETIKKTYAISISLPHPLQNIRHFHQIINIWKSKLLPQTANSKFMRHKNSRGKKKQLRRLSTTDTETFYRRPPLYTHPLSGVQHRNSNRWHVIKVSHCHDLNHAENKNKLSDTAAALVPAFPNQQM